MDIMKDTTCTRVIAGFCIRREHSYKIKEDAKVTIEWGVADTFFTAPAKRTQRGRSTYGIMTDVHEVGFTFVGLDDQKTAKARYRDSIKF